MMLALIFSLLIINPASAKNLDIPRVAQQTPVWCWLATSEMVLKSMNACSPDNDSNYQVSMIKYLVWSRKADPLCLTRPTDCAFPAGGLDSFKFVIDYYSKDGARNCVGGVVVESVMDNVELSLKQLRAEIKSNRPVIAGVNLDGLKRFEAQHAVVLVGLTGQVVRVNDPFNYPANYNPWLTRLQGTAVSEGVYDVDYNRLVKDGAWSNSIRFKRGKL